VEFTKTIHLWKYFWKSVRLRYLSNVGKGGFIIGGAAGNGAVYKRSKLVGFANRNWASDFQAGAQRIGKWCFLSPKRYGDSKYQIEFAAQVSAVAATAGLRQMWSMLKVLWYDAEGGLMWGISGRTTV
jgi:hypothetical protein